MKPGDIVENGWASEDNPLRKSIVIKDKDGIVVCTDGKGGIWDSPKGPKLKVIGHVTLSPIGQNSSEERPDYGWVRVVTVKSETCIICHKKLLKHNVSDLGDCRRDLYRKYLKVAKGLREIHAHLEVAFLGLETKHTPKPGVDTSRTNVREKEKN